jgi:hypothetical protein
MTDNKETLADKVTEYLKLRDELLINTMYHGPPAFGYILNRFLSNPYLLPFEVKAINDEELSFCKKELPKYGLELKYISPNGIYHTVHIFRV